MAAPHVRLEAAMKWIPFLLLCGACTPAYQSQVIVVTPYANGQATVDLHARLGTLDKNAPDALAALLKRYKLAEANVELQHGN